MDELRESLEISKEQEATLCAKAEKEEASVSELITRLLHFGEEAKRAGEVRLDSKKFAGILSCANDKDLVDGSRKFGETLPVSDLDL